MLEVFMPFVVYFSNKQQQCKQWYKEHFIETA